MTRTAARARAATVESVLEDDFLWEGDSPWVETIRYEFERLHLDDWNNARVFKTAELLHCTIFELCAIAGLFDRDEVAKLIKKNRWPTTLTVQWNKLVRFRTGLRSPDFQDLLAAKVCKLA